MSTSFADFIHFLHIMINFLVFLKRNTMTYS